MVERWVVAPEVVGSNPSFYLMTKGHDILIVMSVTNLAAFNLFFFETLHAPSLYDPLLQCISSEQLRFEDFLRKNFANKNFYHYRNFYNDIFSSKKLFYDKPSHEKFPYENFPHNKSFYEKFPYDISFYEKLSYKQLYKEQLYKKQLYKKNFYNEIVFYETIFDRVRFHNTPLGVVYHSEWGGHVYERYLCTPSDNLHYSEAMNLPFYSSHFYENSFNELRARGWFYRWQSNQVFCFDSPVNAGHEIDSFNSYMNLYRPGYLFPFSARSWNFTDFSYHYL